MPKYLCLAVFAALCAPSVSVAMPAEQADAWREDLIQYEQTLEASHIDLYHAISKKKFTKTLAGLEASLTEMSEPELVVALMRLTRRIDDGHTSFPLWSSGYDRPPLALELVKGKLLIVAASDDYANLLGAEIVSINGAPVKRAIAAFADIVPFVENEFSEDVRVAQYILTPKLLMGLGLAETLEGVEIGHYIFDKPKAWAVDSPLRTR